MLQKHMRESTHAKLELCCCGDAQKHLSKPKEPPLAISQQRVVQSGSSSKLIGSSNILLARFLSKSGSPSRHRWWLNVSFMDVLWWLVYAVTGVRLISTSWYLLRFSLHCGLLNVTALPSILKQVSVLFTHCKGSLPVWMCAKTSLVKRVRFPENSAFQRDHDSDSPRAKTQRKHFKPALGCWWNLERW